MSEKLSSSVIDNETASLGDTGGDNQYEDLINTAGPAVAGVEFVADNNDALKLIGDTAIPGHEDVRGRIAGFDKNGLALVTWKSETEDGQTADAIRAFPVDELVAYNQEVENNKKEKVIEMGRVALGFVSEKITKNGETDVSAEIVRQREQILDFIQNTIRVARTPDASEYDRDNRLVRDYYNFRDTTADNQGDLRLYASAMMAGTVDGAEAGRHAGEEFLINNFDKVLKGANDEDRNMIDYIRDILGRDASFRDQGGKNGDLLMHARGTMLGIVGEMSSGEHSDTVNKALTAALIFNAALAGEQAGGSQFLIHDIPDILEKVIK